MAESKPPEDEHQREQPDRVEDKDPATDVSGVPVVQQEALQELARQIVREAGLQAEARQELLELRQHEERVGRYARNLEVLRTTWSLQFEIAKHTSAASGVLLLGLGALVGVFYYPEPSLPSVAAVAAVLLVLSFIGSIAEMTLVRNVILYHMAKDIMSVEVAYQLPVEMAAQQAEGIQPDEERLAEAVEEELEEQLPSPWLGRSTTLWTLVRGATLVMLGGGAVCFLVFALHNLIGGLWP